MFKWIISYRLIKLRLSIVYLYNKGSQVTFSKIRCFIALKIIFTLTNSADPDEMQHFVAFIWVFTVCISTQMVKHPCTTIHCSARRRWGWGGKQKSTESPGLANSM